ncbi:unnamed protein product, partial [Oppiella nova]
MIKFRAKDTTKRMILRIVGGGRDKITEPEDDQSHSDAALANNWTNLNKLRQPPEIHSNENIAAASGRTLRRRLSDQAIKERLRDFQKERRLIYAEQFVNWTLVDWSHFLEDSILPQIDRHFDDGNVHLLHDNHPVHKSNLVRNWINENIGPIEHFPLPHP